MLKAIIYALAHYPQPQVTSTLTPFLKNKRSELRAAAAYALAEIGDTASAQALAELLRRGGKDEDAFARGQAARGLGRVGGHDSIDLLTNALSNDRSQEVRREAALALGRIATSQDAKAIEALRNATLSNDPYLVGAAENAIRQFAYYREDQPGRLRESGLADYLVLLSLYQTCRYRGVSFLKFLLSRETDIDAFC